MKVVFVSGGDRGIGKAITEEFALAGYCVFFTYNISRDSALSLHSALMAKNCNVDFCQANVADGNSIESAVSLCLQRYKHIDVLVCNAGVALTGLATHYDDNDYRRVTDVNCYGTFALCRTVLRSMIKRQSGAIINIASVAATEGISCESLYSLSKGAVLSYSLALAKEVGPSNVRVNVLCPGLIDTDMNSSLLPQDKEQLTQSILLRRMGRPQEVARAALYLAEATYVTGTVLTVDGGLQI